ncbi:hypothetical protein Pcinc_044074 [Petrolisthes cinctipes]|uniref:Transmembrane protein n=1 Tax=Petrolisthes cinctipes TaxID=88211 RepID=A0AAE1EH94_PETCI|nr:hypothetical protein Pcinc_044074 [Petrolisthes cinctipes]
MFSLKYQMMTILLATATAVLFLSESTLAKSVHVAGGDHNNITNHNRTVYRAAGDEEKEGYTITEEKLGWTSSSSSSSTNGSSNVIVSGAGIVWLLLWGVVTIIIGSAVLCYWVGCEYDASTGRGLSHL